MNYDLRNHYPYELNYNGKFKDNLIGNIAVVLFAVSGIAFYTLFDHDFNNGFMIFTLIAGSLYCLSLMSLAFISFNHLKMHLIMVLISVVFAFLIPFSNAIACSIAYKDMKQTNSMIMLIVNAVYCIFIFILIMHPRLSKWAELKEIKNEDGTSSYVRPKYFILAFIEWLLILSSPLVMVLTILTKTLAI